MERCKAAVREIVRKCDEVGGLRAIPAECFDEEVGMRRGVGGVPGVAALHASASSEALHLASQAELEAMPLPLDRTHDFLPNFPHSLLDHAPSRPLSHAIYFGLQGELDEKHIFCCACSNQESTDVSATLLRPAPVLLCLASARALHARAPAH